MGALFAAGRASRIKTHGAGERGGEEVGLPPCKPAAWGESRQPSASHACLCCSGRARTGTTPAPRLTRLGPFEEGALDWSHLNPFSIHVSLTLRKARLDWSP